MIQHQILTIQKITEVVKGFKTFVLETPEPLHYEPGQFITLIDQSGRSEIRRSYSILSSPVLNEALTIAVKRVDNGTFSRKLVDEVQAGDRLVTTGAAGFFRLPANIKSFSELFFFAAGSGIVPIFSIIKTVLYLYPAVSVRLIYSNHSIPTTAFYEELKWLEKKFKDQLHIEFLFSSIADLRRARLNRELLMEFLSMKGIDREKTIFYVCGPENYMRMIIFHLVEEGFPKEHIKKEDFNPGNKKPSLRRPPDVSAHSVKVFLKEIEYIFDVHYPDSILQAAKKIKLELPYSCETGKCGSCAAQCLSGEVWLSDNEVLTEKDLLSGLTLTCTGHPQKGNVVLKIG